MAFSSRDTLFSASFQKALAERGYGIDGSRPYFHARIFSYQGIAEVTVVDIFFYDLDTRPGIACHEYESAAEWAWTAESKKWMCARAPAMIKNNCPEPLTTWFDSCRTEPKGSVPVLSVYSEPREKYSFGEISVAGAPREGVEIQMKR